MVETQGYEEFPLFDPKNRLARRSHPGTPKEAAAKAVASGTVSKDEELAYSMVKKHPNKTANELEDIAGVKARVIGRRLSRLRDKGLIQNGEERICTVSRAKCQTWY